MNIVNLTPHDITVRIEGLDTVFPKSGTVARVSQISEFLFNINGIPAFESKFGDVLDIPEEGSAKDTIYLVSGLVLSAVAGNRADCIAPKTDNTAIRNEAGHIVAVAGFIFSS